MIRAERLWQPPLLSKRQSMANGARQYPSLRIQSLKNDALEVQGGHPWVYYAEGFIQLVSSGRARRRASGALPMRLDTGAFVSLIPEEWLARRQLRRFLNPSSTPIQFQTA